jgi:hypothetical protein
LWHKTQDSRAGGFTSPGWGDGRQWSEFAWAERVWVVTGHELQLRQVTGKFIQRVRLQRHIHEFFQTLNID